MAEIRPRRGARGQALVLMAGGMVAVIAAVALIVDGGNAWANQRMVQNGSDAASEAAAIVMAQRFAGVAAPVGGWDAEVNARLQATAAANNLTVAAAYYTDICGIPLQANGSAALNPDGTENLAVAVRVGSGSLPASPTTTPDCPSSTVGPPAGVMVLGRRDVTTYLAGVVGLNSIGVGTRATAVSGYLQGTCGAAGAEACKVLPVAFPVNIVGCDGSNNPVDTGAPWILGQVYKVPLCQNGPGNVGWLDWVSPRGGTPDLIQSILTPDNPPIDLPSWQYVTATGNVNSAGVENALRTYDGKVVLIPQFDLTCNPGPGTDPDNTSPAITTAPNYGCPPGRLGGNGSNQWYRMPSFAYFELCVGTDSICNLVGASHGTYVNGNNRSTCDTGNGATSCLVGRFVEILSSGTVGAGVGGGATGTKAIGVQLIK